MHRVHALDRRRVLEHDLVRANTYDGSVCAEELLYSLALLQPRNVRDEPEIGDGGVPWAGDDAERREEELEGSAEEAIQDHGVKCEEEDVI